MLLLLAAASDVMPLGKIVHVCDDVVLDQGTGKLNVLGAFNALRPPDGVTYPFHLDHLCVFAQLAGGIGPAIVEVKVVDASTGDEVFGSPAYSYSSEGAIRSVKTAISSQVFPSCPRTIVPGLLTPSLQHRIGNLLSLLARCLSLRCHSVGVL
jgi:hypothetical protein